MRRHHPRDTLWKRSGQTIRSVARLRLHGQIRTPWRRSAALPKALRMRWLVRQAFCP